MSDGGIDEYLRSVVSFMSQLNVRPEGWLYDSVDHFILSEGHLGGPRIDTPNGACSVEKECYRNAAQLAIDHDGMTYVEGYASGIIPVQHAWCVDHGGRVVDPTWDDQGEPHYFGVAFDTGFVMYEADRTETWGIMWENECRPNIPLLTGKAAGWRPIKSRRTL